MATPQEQLAEIRKTAEGIQASINAPKPTEPTPVDAGTIQSKILEEGGIVSSEETGAEKLFAEAETQLKGAKETTEKGIAAKFERARIATEEAGQERITTTEEQRRGFATNAALISKMEKDLTASLRDLDLREQEALAMGRNDIAGKISNLKLQQIEFVSNQKQRDFANRLSVAQFGLGLRELQLKEQAAKAKASEIQYSYKTIKKDKDGNFIFSGITPQGKVVNIPLGIKGAPAGGAGGGGNVGFSQFAVKAGIAGLSEEQARQLVQGEIDENGRPPAWFRTVMDNQFQMNWSEPALLQQWNLRRNAAIDAAQEDILGGIPFPFSSSFPNIKSGQPAIPTGASPNPSSSITPTNTSAARAVTTPTRTLHGLTQQMGGEEEMMGAIEDILNNLGQ